MTPDPKRSPIAALAKKWREEIESVKADPAAAPPLESWVEMADELEAAIAAQWAIWNRDRKRVGGDFRKSQTKSVLRRCMRDLKP